MLYLTYNNSLTNDGVGAQLQRILSIYNLSVYFNFGYIHSSILLNKDVPHYSLKDTMDNIELDKFNNLFNELEVNNKNIDFSETIILDTFCIHFINSINNNSINILIKIGFADSFLDSHHSIINSFIPLKLTWINNKINKIISIAVHIRRGDVSETSNSDRFVDISYYIDCIKNLTNILSDFSLEYNIYTQTSSDSLINSIKNSCSSINITDIILHNNINIIDTFKGMVNADIFIAGKSSLSYTTHFLRNKGIILYYPISHIYSEKHIMIRNPNDINVYKEKIIKSIS